MTGRSQQSSSSWFSSKIEVFRSLRSAMKDGRLGDVAVLKSELGGTRASSALEAELEGLSPILPTIELSPLRALPPGTLGREYAELLLANELKPFRITDAIDPAMLRRNIFIARYSLLHDVYHVLTGFDTSWRGEAGVWGFVAGQRYKWGFWFAPLAACVVYPLVSPGQTLEIWRNAIRGIQMGLRATRLIDLPIEELWETPVVELRRRRKVDAVDELGQGAQGST